VAAARPVSHSATFDPGRSGNAVLGEPRWLRRVREPVRIGAFADGAGLEIDYVIRVPVDRRFRTDAEIERPVGIV